MISEIKKLLECSNAHPFLFVGSGFTHRYLKTEDWRGLVSHFAKQAKPGTEFAFEFYRNEVPSHQSVDIDLPALTELVEKDYNRRFLSEEGFKELRTRHSDKITANVSPLKIGVADLLQSSESAFSTPEHSDEISALGHARMNVAGIITTNFDRYLEHLFPEHVPYIGQSELLFNKSYGVGEIYKIHGCVSAPESLVLTEGDYAAYKSRNAYLSAKLMTIFLEHPIVFVGYSLQDSNIRLIFEDIANCLNEEQLATLASRLVFIQRAKEGRPEGINTVRENFEGKSIEFKQVVLQDFSTLFKAIAAMKSSYPPKILRKLKKDIYDLVQSTTPKEKISVIDIDEKTDLETVEFVMGVGLSDTLAGRGYSGLDVEELTKDLIFEENELDAQQVVEIVLPKRGKQSSFNLPVFKYLSKVDPATIPRDVVDYANDVNKKGIEKWITESMKKSRKGKLTPKSLEELHQLHDCTTAKGLQQLLQDLAFIPIEDINLAEFRDILDRAWKDFDPLNNKDKQTLTGNFRRAVRIYDWLKYEHKKTPEVPKSEEAK